VALVVFIAWGLQLKYGIGMAGKNRPPIFPNAAKWTPECDLAHASTFRKPATIVRK